MVPRMQMSVAPLTQTVPSVSAARRRSRLPWRPGWGLGVKPLIARRGTEHGSGLGTQRWVVERAFAHLHWFRRLRIRWEIRDDIHEAFLTPGCALICRRRLAAVQRRHS